VARIPLIIIAGLAALLLFGWFAGAKVSSDGKLQDADDDRIFQDHRHDSIRVYRHSASRSVPLKARIYEGTSASAPTTANYLDISDISGDIIGFNCMIRNSNQAGKWDSWENNAAATADDEMYCEYTDNDHGSQKNKIALHAVGVHYQGQKYRVIVFYIPKGEW